MIPSPDSPEVESEITAALQGADVVHFGYERGDGAELYKLYFEYAERTRAALAASAPAPTLVHLAFKWDRFRPEMRAWTRYVWPARRGRTEMLSRLQQLGRSASLALKHSRALIERAAMLAPGEDMLMMEVEEPGNPRRSWDVNLYESQLTVGDAADLIEAAAADFGASAATAIFGPRRAAKLGHVSGGVGRSGKEFLTIYYGVEARSGRR